MFSELSDETLLAQLDELVRQMPPREKMHLDDDETLDWRGRVRAVFGHLGFVQSGPMSSALDRLRDPRMSDPAKVRELLHSARHDFRMKTLGPLSLPIDAGAVFHYFDGLTKIIEEAKTDILFVDPYLDKDFVSRYLSHVAPSATVRLLGTQKMPALVAAVELFGKQHGLNIEVRSSEDMHDRYVFIDGRSCYQSGASFKDGGKKPTTLTQIVDPFAAVKQTYEDLWNAAQVEYPRP